MSCGLIQQMVDLEILRVAGEPFSLITGADLALLDPSTIPRHERKMEEDDGLRWPDMQKIEAWLAANSSRFQKGVRYLHGRTGDSRAQHRRPKERLTA
jgi:hypothetical protein